MYEELFEVWKRERVSVEIQRLSKDFYVEMANYVQRMKNETRMLDEKTTRGKLVQYEFKNVKKMIRDLFRLRYNKIFRTAGAGNEVSSNILTSEEEKFQGDVLPSIEFYHALLENVLVGRTLHVETKKKIQKMMLVRFLRETPEIIGSDMKKYGPFKPEDLATLPFENSRLLIKQGMAVEVEAGL